MDYYLQLKKLQLNFNQLEVLIPFKGYEQELQTELNRLGLKFFLGFNKIFFVHKLVNKPVWAQDWWQSVQMIEFESPNHATKILKEQKHMGCYYNMYPNEFPLARKIRKNLREFRMKRLDYEFNKKFDFKYFCWSLLSSHHLLIAEKPSSQFPLGWHEFNEDKTFPPNRAYLKLWEIFALHNIQLDKNSSVIDFGASPGGWTYVLSQHCKKVYALDKAPLDFKVAKIKNIEFKQGDAFKEKPSNYDNCQWFFSDIICTPERLYELVENWINNSSIQNYVCTIKFKGECQFDMIDHFLKISHSKVVHLYHNKHEVTWIRQIPKSKIIKETE